MQVGFIGLGLMGGGMTKNLVNKGVPVKGYDINREVVDRLASEGGTAAASPAEAAAGADVVFTILPNVPHVEGAIFGENGILKTLKPGALYVDCSTIPPDATKSIGKRLKEKGFAMVEAAVGRTSLDAWTGTLIFMVGGEEADVARVTPLLEKMGNTIYHCGPLGSGIATKIVNNYASVTINAVVAEALTLGEKLGCDRDRLVEVMQGTSAGNKHLSSTYPARVFVGDISPAFAMDMAYKDLGLALDVAATNKVPLFTGGAARQAYAIARAAGFGDKDWTSVLLAYRDMAKL